MAERLRAGAPSFKFHRYCLLLVLKKMTFSDLDWDENSPFSKKSNSKLAIYSLGDGFYYIA
jgi:hypothetical protein